LDRGQVDGVYRYFSPATPGEVMQDVVKSFVEKTLGGSVSPFVTYLTETAQVSDADLAELEELVAKLQSKKKEPEA
ncbi:MAG TPA: BlaI/MecI/CopY family transcriptional regulator, partial [Thermoanaerobaculia bacterium]|nr:BlaI/MecI/CopY family transcriptional regulator [Thermoanaerobaculia bacterium]